MFQCGLAELVKLQPQVDDICAQMELLSAEPAVPDTLRPSVTTLTSRHSTAIQELKTREHDITTGTHYHHAPACSLMRSGIGCWLMMEKLNIF